MNFSAKICRQKFLNSHSNSYNMSKQRGLVSFANQWSLASNLLPLLWSSRDKPRFPIFEIFNFLDWTKRSLLSCALSF